MAPKKSTAGSAPASSAGAGELRAALVALLERGKNTAEPVTLGELLAVLPPE